MAKHNELTCEQVRQQAGGGHYDAAVLSHIQTCNRCLDVLLGDLMTSQAVEIPEGFVGRILAEAPSPAHFSVSRHKAFGLAGGILVAIGLGWYRPELAALAQTLEGCLLLAAMSVQTMFIILFAARWTRV